MYTEHGFLQWGIGDIDVLKHEGVYHLFHLVLPSHDYIAHAVSDDGLSWRRVRNALFVGDPGEWDDDMLWTMHTTPDPDRSGWWRMFYTGLTRREGGMVQRIGLARSSDLMTWTKENNGYPLSLPDGLYESGLEEGRHWVSFRDPYFIEGRTGRWLLASARVNSGPVARRGCVALAREVAPNRFEFLEPLYHPRLYDDIEVPVLAKLSDRYYLLGSIREDVKVHYWYADSPTGPFANFFDNVLLPQGNYAARLCRDGEKTLVWNFFFTQRTERGNDNALPPPKELVTDESGRLRLKSFSGFDDQVIGAPDLGSLVPLRPLTGNPEAEGRVEDADCWFGCPYSFEGFLLQGEYDNVRFRFTMEMQGNGKCGILLRIDPEGNGYFLSLDLFRGLAQVRAWGAAKEGKGEKAFLYHPLQSASFDTRGAGPYDMEVLVFGRYIELSVDGFVVLSLADRTYRRGAVGVYTESSRLRVWDVSFEELRTAPGEEYGPET